jgi:hypothetical protein
MGHDGVSRFWPEIVSVHKWPLSAISASLGGITCAAYTSTPPCNAADFLELAKNCAFLDRKLNSVLNETVDGHETGILL